MVLKKKLSRQVLLPYIAQLPAFLIIIEACSGVHYWSRQFESLGYHTKMISSQFVRSYVKYHKCKVPSITALLIGFDCKKWINLHIKTKKAVISNHYKFLIHYPG